MYRLDVVVDNASILLCIQAQDLFFISLKAAMTSTGLVLPVAFWTVGSCETLVCYLVFGIERTHIKSHEDVVKLMEQSCQSLCTGV